MTVELSQTMELCLAYMQKHGGEIHRHPGGFWAKKDWNRMSGGRSFGTSTVEALVARNVADYTEWQESRSGKFTFPILAKLKTNATVLANSEGETHG